VVGLDTRNRESADDEERRYEADWREHCESAEKMTREEDGQESMQGMLLLYSFNQHGQLSPPADFA
jgi:hypothetical protein